MDGFVTLLVIFGAGMLGSGLVQLFIGLVGGDSDLLIPGFVLTVLGAIVITLSYIAYASA